MKDKEYEFIPLLFAGDINIYSVARAFHEEYGIKAYGYGKVAGGPCYGSDIINYTADPKADQPEHFVELVTKFAEDHADKKVILIGCGDSYVDIASKNKYNFPENVIVPCIDNELMSQITNKERFYQLCQDHGVEYPDTFVHTKEMGYELVLPFDAPFIVKPANSITYWEHPFEGQKKVYKINSYEELCHVLKSIYDAGYEDSLIIQGFIPGDDSYMRVLTSYSNKEGKVQMMCLGHVLLEEHTPKGIGNHAVILTEKDEDLMLKYKKLLEEIGYIGFSNFDIKYDERDGRFKAFEINTRQGRSNYYVTASGANVARYLVDDYIYNKDKELELVDRDSLWLVTPKKVAFDYVKDEKAKAEMKRLIKAGKVVNPLIYKPDKALARKLRMKKNIMSHFVKYKKYLGK